MFEMYKESFQDFAPEVPAHVYAGVRKQMSRKSFWKFSAGSFNVFYTIGLAVLASSTFLANIRVQS